MSSQSDLNHAPWGLPNHVFISKDTGKIDETTFRRSVGIANRKHGNKALVYIKTIPLPKNLSIQRLTEGESAIIDFYANPYIRLKLLALAFRECITKRKKDQNISQLGFSAPSWDLQVFCEYAQDILLDDKTYLIDLSDHEYPSEELTYNIDKEGEPKQLHQAIALIRQRADSDLAHRWNTMDGLEKEGLVSVLLALSSLFGTRYLQSACLLHSEIASYFSESISRGLLNLTDACKPNDYRKCDDACTNIGTSTTRTKAIDTKAEWEKQLRSALSDFIESPQELELAENLINAINQYQSWSTSRATVADVETTLTSITILLGEALANLGVASFIPEEKESFYPALLNDWRRWAHFCPPSDISEPYAQDWIRHWDAATFSIAEAKKKIDSHQTSLAQIRKDIDNSNSLLASRTLKQQESITSSALHDLKIQLIGHEDALIVAALPTGSTLEQLEKSETVGAPPSGWPPVALLDTLNLMQSHLKTALVKAQPEFDAFSDSEVEELHPSDDQQLTEPTQYSCTSEHCDNPDSSTERLKDEALDNSSPHATPHSEDGDNAPLIATVSSEDSEDTQVHSVPLETEQPQPTPVKSKDTIQIIADSDVGRACLEELLTDVFISGDILNSAITHLVAIHRLPYAAQLAYVAETGDLSDNFLSYRLLKAAYYGMNTYNRSTFDKARRQLLSIQKSELEEWQDQIGGELVPYLVFLAVFQPALFGGNMSTAIMFLRDLPENMFDHHTHGLITDIIEMANRGEPLTASHLKPVNMMSAREEPQFDHQNLVHWEQKIRDSRRGYAPVLKALAYCLEQGLFHKVTSIIYADDRQKHDLVENFVSTYQDKEASTSLLNELLATINMAPGEGITRIGKERFHHKVLELVYIAQDWLELAVQTKGSVTEDFNKRFHTRLSHAITYYQDVSNDKQQSISRQSGASIVAYSLQLLKDRLSHPDAVWPYGRIKGWYYLPRDVANLHLPETSESSSKTAQWLLERLNTDLCTRQTLDLALERQKLRLVELLKLQLQDAGETITDVDTNVLFQTLQQELYKQCNRLQGMLENALLSALIDSTRAEQLSGQLADSEEFIGQLTILDDADAIRFHFHEIDQELRTRMIRIKQELRQACDAGMQALLKAVSVDPLPPEWERNLEQAFENDNIPVLFEMRDELIQAANSGRRIELAAIKNVPVLRDFTTHEEKIYQGVISSLKENKNGLRNAVTSNAEEVFGLTFGSTSSHFKRALHALSQWNNSKPKSSVDQEMYLDLCAILQLLGISPSEQQFNNQLKQNIHYQTATGFSSLRIPIAFSQSTRPFAIFGDKIRGGGHLQIMIAHKPWQPQNLSELKASHNIHEEALLISAVPISPAHRQEFAHYFKRKQQMVLHVDMVTLLFLAAQEQGSIENVAIRNFLWLSAPYTYFNPYGGDTLKPPLPEMRYGRENQIQQLLNMNNGAAIVYGGRQLGKSTILQEVQYRFNKPEQHKYAFYEMLDKDLHKRIDISKEAHFNAKRTIWRFMYNSLVRAQLIKRSNIVPSDDDCIRIVRQAIIEDQKNSFIVIFDEIDPILNVDSQYDFSIFRGLRDLVANHAVAGRFKVIIGGLENVKRFENSPNYPLTQMGAVIQVEIMPTQEAIHLVTEPMIAAGYSFDNVRVVNYILAITNRHPGLIQAFCSELINYLSANRNQAIGTCVITNEDVESIGRKPEVSDLIRKRFDMTLNLDDRYLVIIYGIIDDGRGAQPFSVEYAKGIADIWLPDAFNQLSNRQFETFLDELIGLGVLRKNDDGRYALRNTNVLKLLVDIKENDVGHRLEMAIENYKNYDPLDRHAYDPERHTAPSPITYRDERAVIGVGVDRNVSPVDNLPGHIPPQLYTTTMIVGSEAQGIDQVQSTLPSIYEEENTRRTYSKGDQIAYVPHTYQSCQFRNPADFEKRLLHLLTSRSNRAPQMAFVNVSNDTDISDLLGLIDAAHGFADQVIADHYPVRVIFLLDPAAYWKWLSHRSLTLQRENLQPFIKLVNWSNGAISALLERIGMNDSNDAVENLLKACQGWYETLRVIASTRKQHPEWTDIDQFNSFQPLTELNLNHSEKFLKMVGMDDVHWAKPLLISIVKAGEDSLDKDLITLYAEEVGIEMLDEDGAKARIRWLVDMGMLVGIRQPSKQTKGQLYSLAPAIAHALQTTMKHETR